MSTLHDLLWYPNNSVSPHLTPDASNHNHQTPYTSSNMVNIGNNSGFSIKNIASTSYITPHFSKKISLNKLLHVCSISKSWLSVSKFAKDNLVFL